MDDDKSQYQLGKLITGGYARLETDGIEPRFEISAEGALILILDFVGVPVGLELTTTQTERLCEFLERTKDARETLRAKPPAPGAN
jgi:hypothetical protein